ncbi:MAG: CBS domain-containing protein [Acidobacteriota bacterium]|jgi:CBS domain-containing protein
MEVEVSEVMEPRVFVVMPDDKVAYVREVMKGKKIHAVPVFNDEDRPLGIITATDLIDAPHGEMEVSDIMSREVVTIGQEASVKEAARIMRSNHVHHLLVTSDEEVVGIISSFDLLKVIENNGFRARSSGN